MTRDHRIATGFYFAATAVWVPTLISAAQFLADTSVYERMFAAAIGAAPTLFVSLLLVAVGRKFQRVGDEE